MTDETTLVPLEQHSRLTVGPARFTDTRVRADVFDVARAVYGTSSEDDDKRVYRTLQAALWKLAERQAPAPAHPAEWRTVVAGAHAFLAAIKSSGCEVKFADGSPTPNALLMERLHRELGELLAAPCAAVAPMTPRQAEVLHFLYGSGMLEGRWFGDDHRPLYWWRSILREVFPDLAAKPPVQGTST